MMDDDEIRALVTRLARPRREGGHTVERAAILAAGAESGAVEAWILAHAGLPEEQPQAVGAPGLHGGRLQQAARQDRRPTRFRLPPATLAAVPSALAHAPDEESSNAPQEPRDHIDLDDQTTAERG